MKVAGSAFRGRPSAYAIFNTLSSKWFSKVFLQYASAKIFG